MTRPLRYTPLGILLALIATGCKGTPSGVLSRDDMTALMADVYRGESMIEFNGNIYTDDSTKKIVKQSILMTHGVTEAQFDSSLSWYGHHIEEFVKVCDGAISLLENELEMIPNDVLATSLQVAGDSASVWMLPSYYRITSKLPARFISFSLDKDEEWEPGDSYTLSYKANTGKNPITSSMAVNYEDSLAEFATISTTEPGWQKLVVRLDSTRVASKVYGYIGFDPADDEVIYIDSVSLLRVRKSPTGYYHRSNLKKIELKPDVSNKK